MTYFRGMGLGADAGSDEGIFNIQGGSPYTSGGVFDTPSAFDALRTGAPAPEYPEDELPETEGGATVVTNGAVTNGALAPVTNGNGVQVQQASIGPAMSWKTAGLLALGGVVGYYVWKKYL